MANKYKVVIGLEIHVQLTESPTKLFCQCKANYRNYPPNTNVCPVCLGMPGALPVVQEKPLIYSLAASIALGCKPSHIIVFTRKHYFYPDLPKNYQITEYEGAHGSPVCRGGVFTFLNPTDWAWKKVRIRRINLEEDPGRSIYEAGGIISSPIVKVDYNRSGVPLLEIVTEPDLSDPKEARALVEFILLTLEYLGIVNPRLEGAFRVDANISLEGGERVEIKNIGSAMDVEKALSYEIIRQKHILASGGKVRRETRHWDSQKGMTFSLRTKETEEEYLYFPDPDLPPIIVTEKLLRRARELIKILPDEVYTIITGHGIQKEIAWSITKSPHMAKLYLNASQYVNDKATLARLIGVDLKGELKEKGVENPSLVDLPGIDTIIRLVKMVEEKELTYDTIKGLVIPKLVENPGVELEAILPGKTTITEDLIIEVLENNNKAVCDYLRGKQKALNYLVGAVIRRLGKVAVDPREIREHIIKCIEKRMEKIECK